MCRAYNKLNKLCLIYKIKKDMSYALCLLTAGTTYGKSYYHRPWWIRLVKMSRETISNIRPTQCFFSAHGFGWFSIAWPMSYRQSLCHRSCLLITTVSAEPLSSSIPSGGRCGSVGRARGPGEEFVGSISAPGVRSLLVGSVSVECGRLRQKSWSPRSVSVWQHVKL